VGDGKMEKNGGMIVTLQISKKFQRVDYQIYTKVDFELSTPK
jgi:hypothetical protein